MYTNISFAQAFFEAISGFTTTGATIYSDIESLPNMILMLRSLTHWLGGMGIIVLGVGLLSYINPTGSMTLFKAESTGIKLDKATPKIKDTAIRLWGIYVGLTALNVVFLMLGGMSFFDALNHAFSTISTGGFSTKNGSIGDFHSSYILWITTLFMILSGINFLVHLRFLSGKRDSYKNEETIYYILIFVIISLSISLYLSYDEGLPLTYSLTHSFFNVASLITTTGFASTNYEEWGQVAVALFFLAMLLGGSGGSTAGGVKVIRFIVIAKVMATELKKVLHPSAIIKVFIDKNIVSNSIVLATFGFITLYIFINLLLTFYLYARGYDALTSISAALACVGNIGPGFAKVGPAMNYSFFSDVDDIILAISMIIGRLEIYTFVLIFLPNFWRRF
jgi:trk system potassium uptake protein TrkH